MQPLQIISIAAVIVSFCHNVTGDLYPAVAWEKTFGDSASSIIGLKIIPAVDSGFIVLATSNNQPCLMHLDGRGELIWTRQPPVFGVSICQTGDRGYLIAGSSGEFVEGEGDLMICKLNVHGDTLWTRIYRRGDIGPDTVYGSSFAEAALPAPGGGFLIAGCIRYSIRLNESGFANGPSTWLLRTGPDGDTLGTELYFNGRFNSQPHDACPSVDGGYMLLVQKMQWPEGVFHSQLWLLRTDSAGDSLSSKLYPREPGLKFMSPASMCATPDGGFAIAGVIPRDSAASLLRTDAQGDTLWSQTFSSPSFYGYSSFIAATPDSGFIINCPSLSDGVTFPFMLRTDSRGTPLWTHRVNRGYLPNYAFQSETVPLDGGGFIAFGTATREIDLTSRLYLWVRCIKELTPPAIESAVADDNVLGSPEIDADDYILISLTNASSLKLPEFSDYASITASNIDDRLALSNGHSWLSGAGMVGSITWNNDSSRIAITLSTVGGAPTIQTGDTITFAATGRKTVLAGSFSAGVASLKPALASQNRMRIIRDNGSTSIVCCFSPENLSRRADLRIFDSRGRRMLSAVFISHAGEQRIRFDNDNRRLPSGLYIADLLVDGTRILHQRFMVTR